MPEKEKTLLDYAKKAILDLSPEFFKAILEDLANGVSVVDAEGNFLFVNKAAERLVGVEHADLNPDEWSRHFGVFRPDGVTEFPTQEFPLVRALKGEKTNNIEMIIRNGKL